MPEAAVPLVAFNRGEVSPLALGRVDVEKLRLAAETMNNWLPLTLGPMMLRPGSALVNEILGDQPSVTLPFIYGQNDTALIELTPNALRVLVGDQVLTRPATPGSNIPGAALTDPSQWTVTATPGASATIGGGQLILTVGAIKGAVQAYTRLFVGAAGVEHALHFTVTSAPVNLRVGTGAHGDDVLATTKLFPGTHSIAITPQMNPVFVEFEGLSIAASVVNGFLLEPAGEMQLPTAWGVNALPNLRWDQSASVVFVACLGQQPYRIERRGYRSWSMVAFHNDDGPFQIGTPEQTTLSIDGFNYSPKLTASRPAFKGTDVGRLVSVFTSGYDFTYPLAADGAATPAIRVSGVGTSRNVTIAVTGTNNSIWQLQRSVTGPDSGFSVYKKPDGTSSQVQGDATVNFNDATDNASNNNLIAWYRIVIVTFAGSTPVQAQMIYGGSGSTGIYRITQFLSATQAVAQTIVPASSDAASSTWSFGEWSDTTLWPTAVALFDGRLAFAGGDRLWLSVSDSFSSFAATLADGTTVGDSSAISRSIGYGPVAIINWLLPLQRLILGSIGSEVSVRSSALDAPLTPTGGTTLRDCSTQGSASIPAAKCDTRGLFVQFSGQRLMMLGYNVDSQDYAATDLNQIHPDLNLGAGIIRIAVQRQPNTRIHCIRSDGTAVVLVYEPSEEVSAWYHVIMAGAFIEDVAVLPDLIEDRVYYTVRRGTRRYRERFARLDEARGGTLSKCMDAHVVYQGAATNNIGGLGHLEGMTVCCYADGKDQGGPFTVQNGSITLPTAVSQACVGLPYDALFKSAKLAYAAKNGTALNRRKRLLSLGLVLSNAHKQGLRYGQDFQHMDPMPLEEDEAAIDPTGGWNGYDEKPFTVDGTWDTDARLFLLAQSPRPVTVVAASIEVATNG